jgi:CheY-like chemotaxis protein
LGIAAYLTKPIKQSDLLDAILLALGVTSVEDEGFEERAARRPAAARPLRILLAEDSLVNQKLAVALLEREGHAVTVAQNGKEAIKAFVSQEFDLVLMDVQMPEMDGFEATAAIRERQRQTGINVPIVAMTAHALKGDRERCLEAGMDDYVSKPIRASQLLTAIEKVSAQGPGRGGAGRETLSEGQTVDWTEALKAVRGDQRLLKTLVEAALEDCRQQMPAIERAIADGDRTALRLAAHTLKGAIRYFGQSRAFEHALRLEQLARENDLEEARQVAVVLEPELRRLTEDLSQYLRAGDARGQS